MIDSFVTVPETTLPGGTIVPSFRVGTYVCTKTPSNVNIAAVTADDVPWVDINFAEAKAACAAAGYALITERQWLAIAHDVAGQDCNWSKGKVGAGELFQGLRNSSVYGAQPGTVKPNNPKERRWLTLSNGAQICDLNGNVFQWVFDDVQGDEKGRIASPFAADSLSLQAPYPSLEKGMGWRPNAGADWSGDALIRGGTWDSEAYAGAFCLGVDWPDLRGGGVGFRCTQPIGL